MKKLIIFILVLFTFFGYFPMTNLTASATQNEQWVVPMNYEITSSSNVMVDLSSLDGFRTSNYNYSNVEVYDVEIIALVETKEKDLIVYTFEPRYIGSEDNRTIIFSFEDFSNNYYSTQSTPNYITSINISKTIGNKLNISNYDLSRVESYYDQFGVFSKFIVEDFEIKSSSVRYYEIPSILSTLSPTGENVSERAYKVATRFKFETKEDGTKVKRESVNYEITSNSDIIVDFWNLDSFSIANYIYSDVELYDIEVIALAETKKKELIIYTFEPRTLGSGNNITTIFSSADFSNNYSSQSTPNYISSINISKTIGDDLSIANYNLSRVQSYYDQFGVFAKYIVEDFEIESSLVRYYEIPSIFSTLTPKGIAVSGNTTEQAYKVASRFKFETQNNGTTKVEYVGTKVITVTSKYCGFVRYKTNSRPSWVDTYYGGGYKDRHFIAFSTDINMDRLMEADVYYSKETRTLKQHASNITCISSSGKSNVTKTLNGELEEVGESGSSFLGMWVNQKYNFYNIEDITTFSQEFTRDRTLVTFFKAGYFGTSVPEEITEEGLNEISDKEWVLSYEVTDYSEQNSSASGSTYYDDTVCGDVTILRLKFITDGVTYNLGVVDNKTNEDTEPINNVSKGWSAGEWSAYRIGQVAGFLRDFLIKPADKLWDKIKAFWDKYKFWIITALVLILLFTFSPVLSFLILILKFIVKIIRMPFKGIYTLINRRKK